MNIAIDGYEANTIYRVGIGEYAYEILSGMHSILEKKQKKDIFCSVYLPEHPLPDLPTEKSFWKYLVKKPKKFWTIVGLPLHLSLSKPDVVFSPTHYIPRYINFPRVCSIMDLSFLRFPELFKTKDYYQLFHWTKYSIQHAKAIFTISNFSRNAIINEYNFDPKRIFVTYPGITKRKFINDKIKTMKYEYLMNKPYILSVGTIQPRKNYEKLIEAFSYLKKNSEFLDLELVIVGKKGWLYESILAAPEKFNVSNSVKFLDFVPDEELPQLYKNARCFVLPSLYEGFGLPVLEAMAHEIIVITSNVSSLPEIAGDAGIYVEPESVESIAHGIKQALHEYGTNEGKQRIQKGKERVKLFNWDTAAAQTLDILEKIGKGEL